MNTTNSLKTNSPKVLVLGASGPTGQLIVRGAVSRGFDVTALVRPTSAERRLDATKVVRGDARDERALRESLQGRDTVISALGTAASPLKQVTLLSSATRALISAMKAEGVRRLVCITGLGAGDSRGHGGMLFDRLIFPLLLRHVYADKNRQEDLVRGSGLDWVLVRPSILNDEPAHGSVRALTDLSDFGGGTVSREDVASFVLDQVHGDAWLHRAPLITW